MDRLAIFWLDGAMTNAPAPTPVPRPGPVVVLGGTGTTGRRAAAATGAWGA